MKLVPIFIATIFFAAMALGRYSCLIFHIHVIILEIAPYHAYLNISGEDDIDSQDRCFDLNVNDCIVFKFDCDLYCKMICENEGKDWSYDSEIEICCCLD